MEIERAVLAGATGFIGSNLLRYLDYKYHVVAIGRDRENKLDRFDGEVINAPFHKVNWDHIGSTDILFHQAAITDTTITEESEMLYVNVEASTELFRKAIENGCKRIVYASSTAVYGNSPAPFVEGEGEEPLNVYGRSKLLLDQEAMKLAEENPEVKIVGLRYCNVYGPGESYKGKNATMVYQLAQQMLHGNPRIFKDGEQKRDHIYIQDVVRANLYAAKARKSCIVNCGTGQAVSFNQMLEILGDVLGIKRETEYLDNPYDFFQNHTECNMDRAKEMIGFTPHFSFSRGVRDYYDSGKLTEAPTSL